MLPDKDRTKEQLVSELEASEAERKQAEETLRESEEKYKTLFENLNDPAFLADTETGRIIDTNKQGELLLGCPREEIIGMHQSELHPPEKTSEYRQRFSAHTQKGRAADYDGEAIRKDGSIIAVSISASPINIGGKKLIVGLFRDITERKQVEQTLSHERDLIQTLFENHPDFIYFKDSEARFHRASKRFCDFFGLRIEDIVGKTDLELFPEEVAKQTHSEDLHIIKTGIPLINKEESAGGVWVLTTKIPWFDKEGNIIGLFGISRDITERKQAKEREEELQQELSLSRRLAAVGELAAGVAHEINNPLTGILGFSERLLRKSTDEETRRDLERIYSEAQRMVKVMDNLRAFTRRREPEKQYSDINDILHETLELRAYELRTGNIEVVTDFTPGLPEIEVDSQQIQEVFLNIILNAEQAVTEAHTRGKLTIKTGKMKDYVRISFTDDGPGIPAEDLDKLFDPFFTTRGEQGGTGLGLSVCHNIVAGHGGRLYAKSKPGEGATFFVELHCS